MAVITGDDKSNNLKGTPEPDLIVALAGDDRLRGEGGDDELDPGPGRDRVEGGPGLDTLILSGPGAVSLADGEAETFAGSTRPEKDRLSSIEAVRGSAGDDIIIGDEAANILHGGRGDDLLDGEEGDDTLLGDEGRDQLLGDEGEDMQHGGPGGDFLLGDAGADHLHGESGPDVLDGGDEDDYLDGGDGADLLVGAEGRDRLAGGLGRDALFGGPGDDEMEGGKAADLFRGEAGDDHITLGQGRDTAAFVFSEQLPDFESIDHDTVMGFVRARHQLDIDLEGFLPDGRTAAIDARDFLDSNDDGRIDDLDSEVRRVDADLVLDIDALMTRALGAGDFGDQDVTLKGVASFSAERILAAENPPFFLPLVTEDGVVEPVFGAPPDEDLIA